MNKVVPAFRGRMTDGGANRPFPKGIETGEFAPWCADAYCERTGTNPAMSFDSVRLVRENELPEEGYRITVEEKGVEVSASCERGAIWGLTTLYLLKDQEGQIPVCRIEDAPAHGHRGLMLDCARHFFSAGEVKKIIEYCTLAKINVLHWHLSDDQGWRIESRQFLLLHETSGSYYTQNEIRQIVEYARRRGMEIIPEIDLPGHTSGILAAYPEYGCRQEKVQLAECGGIYRTILCAGKEDAFTFLDMLLKEVCGLFPSGRFHIGGDEAPKNEWEECPDCRKRMENERHLTADDLQGYFSNRVAGILKKYGKTPVCWDDTLISDLRPEGMAVQYWNIQRAKQLKDFSVKGKFIYSDMFELYLDYPHSMIPLKKIYGSCPKIGKKDFRSSDSFMGMEACLWSEHIETEEELEKHIFPRIYALAENTWSDSKDYSSFLLRLPVLMKKCAEGGAACTPLESCNPKGRVRQSETMAYFLKMNSAMTPEIRAKTVESAKPSREFARRFATQFFRLSDMPLLLKVMKQPK
ncbi:MAG TPA: family 20 glycosylhydrolase [Lachnospiraceae bacterium]|nr:family 20 glycosylhydrolase [Lachnospiraceae bacterium]